MAYTPHYQFALYDGGQGDPAALLSVYNVAMNQVDALAFRLQQQITDNEADIIALQTRCAGIEAAQQQLSQQIATLQTTVSNLAQTVNANKTASDAKIAALQASVSDLVSKFYGGGSIGTDGHITWPNGDKAAVGNMSLYGNSNRSLHIQCRADGDTANGDLWGL